MASGSGRGPPPTSSQGATSRGPGLMLRNPNHPPPNDIEIVNAVIQAWRLWEVASELDYASEHTGPDVGDEMRGQVHGHVLARYGLPMLIIRQIALRNRATSIMVDSRVAWAFTQWPAFLARFPGAHYFLHPLRASQRLRNIEEPGSTDGNWRAEPPYQPVDELARQLAAWRDGHNPFEAPMVHPQAAWTYAIPEPAVDPLTEDLLARNLREYGEDPLFINLNDGDDAEVAQDTGDGWQTGISDDMGHLILPSLGDEDDNMAISDPPEEPEAPSRPSRAKNLIDRLFKGKDKEVAPETGEGKGKGKDPEPNEVAPRRSTRLSERVQPAGPPVRNPTTPARSEATSARLRASRGALVGDDPDEVLGEEWNGPVRGRGNFRVHTEDRYARLPPGVPPTDLLLRELRHLEFRTEDGTTIRIDTLGARCQPCIEHGYPNCMREFGRACYPCVRSKKGVCVYVQPRGGGKTDESIKKFQHRYWTDWRVPHDEATFNHGRDRGLTYPDDTYRAAFPKITLDAPGMRNLGFSWFDPTTPPPATNPHWLRGRFEVTINPPAPPRSQSSSQRTHPTTPVRPRLPPSQPPPGSADPAHRLRASSSTLGLSIPDAPPATSPYALRSRASFQGNPPGGGRTPSQQQPDDGGWGQPTVGWPSPPPSQSRPTAGIPAAFSQTKAARKTVTPVTQPAPAQPRPQPRPHLVRPTPRESTTPIPGNLPGAPTTGLSRAASVPRAPSLAPPQSPPFGSRAGTAQPESRGGTVPPSSFRATSVVPPGSRAGSATPVDLTMSQTPRTFSQLERLANVGGAPQPRTGPTPALLNLNDYESETQDSSSGEDDDMQDEESDDDGENDYVAGEEGEFRGFSHSP